MREIKFRGYCEDMNEWVYGSLVHIILEYTSEELLGTDDYYIADEQGIQFSIRDTKTIGQFTGLKDKNGIEIYEGDIISNGQEKCLVIYDEEYAGFFLKLIDENFNKEKNWTNPMIDLSRKDEVIGNIHDNPELLKEE